MFIQAVGITRSICHQKTEELWRNISFNMLQNWKKKKGKKFQCHLGSSFDYYCNLRYTLKVGVENRCKKGKRLKTPFKKLKRNKKKNDPQIITDGGAGLSINRDVQDVGNRALRRHSAVRNVKLVSLWKTEAKSRSSAAAPAITAPPSQVIQGLVKGPHDSHS